MKVLKIFIILIGLCFSVAVYAQDVYKDPFMPLLPGEDIGETVIIREEAVAPPDISIEGILWGSDRPQTIIDGEVYGVGDKLLTVDAEIIRIEKDTILISYEGVIHKMSVRGAKERESFMFDRE